jgi:ABC-type sugar transport system permease subunit
MATTNRKRFDLNAGAFDFQGRGVGQFLIMLPVIIPPLLIVSVFRYGGYPDYGLPVIGLLGLFGLILYRPLLRLIHSLFKKQKYQIATSFRES